MQPSVAEYARRYATADRVTALDIGGRDINGHARGEWPNASWTVLDLRPADGVDVVADARTWKPDRAYDLVLCTDMLEHVRRWPEIIATAAAALRPGGLLVVTAAGPGWPPHSDFDGGRPRPGEHFEVITAPALHQAFTDAGLDVVEALAEGRDTHGAARRPGAPARKATKATKATKAAAKRGSVDG